MLHATKGIVFHSVKYSETSVIVKIYTELFGIQSYLFKGVHSPKSKTRPGLFQPMTLLDLVVYHKEKQSLQHAREVHLARPYHTLPFDIRKSSVALFMNELVYKTIREEEANPDLFVFLWNTCILLDDTADPVSAFPLFFALRFCHYLGIFPLSNHSNQFTIFNLREGVFQAAIPDHQNYLDPENSKLLHTMLEVCGGNPEDHETLPGYAAMLYADPFIRLKAETRNRLLETLLLYYRLHLPGFKGLQSHHILHDVMA